VLPLVQSADAAEPGQEITAACGGNAVRRQKVCVGSTAVTAASCCALKSLSAVPQFPAMPWMDSHNGVPVIKRPLRQGTGGFVVTYSSIRPRVGTRSPLRGAVLTIALAPVD
jgi:hypothetical protein